MFSKLMKIASVLSKIGSERLLKRYGTGKGYLNETQSGSFRPSGLHIRRAGV
jgi:hypothetical protein